MVVRKRNRMVARSPRGSKGWCDHCDLAYLAGHEKCPRCGHRNNDRREKLRCMVWEDRVHPRARNASTVCILRRVRA